MGDAQTCAGVRAPRIIRARARNNCCGWWRHGGGGGSGDIRLGTVVGGGGHKESDPTQISPAG
jgi:hypothetical protein